MGKKRSNLFVNIFVNIMLTETALNSQIIPSSSRRDGMT